MPLRRVHHRSKLRRRLEGSRPPAGKGRGVFALGRNTVIAGLVGGAAAGILGSRATVFVDSSLNEQKETLAFVLFISLLLGGFLRSSQMLIAWNWAAGALHFLVGAVVGGGAGMIAIPLADLVVKAVSTDELIPNSTSTAMSTPAMVSAPLFAIVAGMVGLALGLLRSTKTGLATLAAGAIGGAIGGAIFGATVAKYRHGYLDVSFLSIPTILIVALVGASIGVTYGFAVRARRTATLTIIEGRNSGLEISIEGRRATIGSKSTCDLVLRGDDAVAGVHATLVMDGGTVHVDPSGGRVLVNGVEAPAERDLASGDVLMVGGSYIRMELKGAS